ncbi:MAG TPA: hypothetical protein VKT82_23640 [Ktedonobacterales bacterium]|nr:hypothetical protein [Ktedonobacterales bacterium]
MRVSPRGRAILQPIAVETASERTYRPGDFVLTHSGGTLAWSMGAATVSRLNQAALIVDSSGGLIEVNPFFITVSGGLRRAHVHEYLERGAPVLVGYVELLEGTRSEVVRFAEQMLEEQQRFSEWQFAGLLMHVGLGIAPRHLSGKVRALRPLHALFDHHALVFKEENIFTSAELVARALERGGFLWGKDPAYMTPADLLERFCPPGRAQELRQMMVPKLRPLPVRAPVGADAAPGAPDAEDAGEAALLRETPEDASDEGALAVPSASPAHPQEQMAWGVGALLMGGLMVTLGLGWAARMLKLAKEK